MSNDVVMGPFLLEAAGVKEMHMHLDHTVDGWIGPSKSGANCLLGVPPHTLLVAYSVAPV